MLRLQPILILLFILLSLPACKSDLDSMVQGEVSTDSIAGVWKLIEKEEGTYGKKYWMTVAAKPSDTRIFRSDGVILTADSLEVCCRPKELLINGKLIEVKALDSIAPNPTCALIECVACPTWEIEYRGRELIITYCDGLRLKYQRQ